MPQRGCISSAQGTTLGINAERIQIGYSGCYPELDKYNPFGVCGYFLETPLNRSRNGPNPCSPNQKCIRLLTPFMVRVAPETPST